jgi:hypothetical protein
LAAISSSLWASKFDGTFAEASLTPDWKEKYAGQNLATKIGFNDGI